MLSERELRQLIRKSIYVAIRKGTTGVSHSGAWFVAKEKEKRMWKKREGETINALREYCVKYRDQVEARFNEVKDAIRPLRG